MAGGRRGPGRPQLSRTAPPPPMHATNVLGNSAQTTTIRHRNGPGAMPTSTPLATLITITPIHHPVIPALPVEGNLTFEVTVVLYLLTVLFLQYVNIYKTVWWLPMSPSLTAVNLYLIDPYLVMFIIIVLTRRLVWSFIVEVAKDAKVFSVLFYLVKSIKFILAISVLGLAVWSLWKLFLSNSPLNLFFLAYPLVSYFLLYGLTFDLNKSVFATVVNKLWPKGEAPSPLDKSVSASPLSSPSLGCAHESSTEHKCTHVPMEVRKEADVLKYDFNTRMKSVLFNSMVCAYYVGFVPICFLQPSMYLDLWWACLMIAFVWINSFIMFSSHFLPAYYCDTLHRCSLHLGKWQKVDHGYSNTPQHLWSDATVWPQGVLVRYNKGLYKAMGQQNVALPSDGSYARFYFMFHEPLRVLNGLLCLQVGVILFQLYLLAMHTHWNHVISLSLLLFCNYYVLFKLLRDRIILGRAYHVKEQEVE
ncbi:transmembrane protein 39A-like [Acanthaster planci]|uniref:Transmembrane protein 39A-like n=1 Tax=Acanthaster planci TaxID=133434 RepID=A0A8B7XQ16_ACAPL|nr:transmembrane protein 39A-like [Acanthaster planci]